MSDVRYENYLAMYDHLCEPDTDRSDILHALFQEWLRAERLEGYVEELEIKIESHCLDECDEDCTCEDCVKEYIR